MATSKHPKLAKALVYGTCILAGFGLISNLGNIIDFFSVHYDLPNGQYILLRPIIAGILLTPFLFKTPRKLAGRLFNVIKDKVKEWITPKEDPMTLLKRYVDDLERNFRNLQTHISKLHTQMAKIKDIMKQNSNEIARSSRLIDEAKRQGRNEVVAVNYNQVGRLTKLNEKYALMMGRMEELNDVLVKMHTYSSYKLNDTKNEIRMKEQEMQALSSGYYAMMSAKNIMEGDYAQNNVYAEATEQLTIDLHTKIAELDNFMQLSSPMFDDMDMQRTLSQLEGENYYEKLMAEGRAFLNNVDYKDNGNSYFAK